MTTENIYITIIDRIHVHHLIKLNPLENQTLAEVIKKNMGCSWDCIDGQVHQCHIRVLAGQEKLCDISQQESQMLSKLCTTDSTSRLACQIKICTDINALIISL